MVDSQEVHPLVELLLARMKSNPGEFCPTTLGANERTPIRPDEAQRWRPALRVIDEYGSEADKQAIAEALGALRMDHAHQWALDELLNGEERRRKEHDLRDLWELVTRDARHQNMQNMQNQYALDQLNALKGYSIEEDLARDELLIKNLKANDITAISRDYIEKRKGTWDEIKKLLKL